MCAIRGCREKHEGHQRGPLHGVLVTVGVGVSVGVDDGVGVNRHDVSSLRQMRGSLHVTVGVGVGVTVIVGVGVGVVVFVGVGVRVGVGVGVRVRVRCGVAVGGGVKVTVGVALGVDVGVGVAQDAGLPHVPSIQVYRQSASATHSVRFKHTFPISVVKHTLPTEPGREQLLVHGVPGKGTVSA